MRPDLRTSIFLACPTSSTLYELSKRALPGRLRCYPLHVTQNGARLESLRCEAGACLITLKLQVLSCQDIREEDARLLYCNNSMKRPAAFVSKRLSCPPPSLPLWLPSVLRLPWSPCRDTLHRIGSTTLTASLANAPMTTTPPTHTHS